jgi:hypothetical protein
MWINLKRFYIKTMGLFARLLRAVWFFPIRLFRIFKHLGLGLHRLISKKPKLVHWWQDFAFLLLDLVALPEVYETCCDFGKWNTRPLSPLERKLAESVFGNALQLDKICLDDRAKIGCKKRKIVYVSFFTVNAWGRIQPATFIHELVHIWQYQKMGAAYMTNALRAQKTKEGYNYGGSKALKEAMEKRAKITDFNLEQQADIVADYYAIREGLKPVWGKGTSADLPAYQYFVAQIREDTV